MLRQRLASVYIRGLILRNSTELAGAVMIDYELDRDGIHVLVIFEFDKSK